MEKQTKLIVGAISLTTIVAIIIACYKLSQPGLYYDEMLFVNGATGGHTNIFIRSRVLGIPVLLMDYIGALKAWIYYPIFSIFGVNPWSVRLPAILIGTAGALMLTAALWRGFGPRAALAGALMIVLDPTMIIHSRLDWGPNALMFFFRGLLVLSIINWVQTLSVRWAWIAVIAIALGIFDKLNFIWMVCAAMGSVTFIYFDKLKTFTRQQPKQAWLIAGVAIAIVGAAILKGIRIAEHMDVTWSFRIQYAISIIHYTLAGGGALNFIAGDGLRFENTYWLAYLLPAIVCIWGITKIVKDGTQKKMLFWLVTLVMLVTLAFVFTKTATGPHHASMLCGLWQLLLAPLVAMAWNKLDGKITAGKVLYATSLVAVAAGNIIVVVSGIKALAKPINVNWDPANFQAALLAKKYPNANFLCTDWGMGTLAVGVSPLHTNIYDQWPEFTTGDGSLQIIKSLDRTKDTYIYTLLPGFENFKGNRANLLNALQANGIKPSLFKTYSNWQGKPIIEVLYLPGQKLNVQTPLKDFKINGELSNVNSRGFYNTETADNGAFRWTNGDGQLNLPNLYTKNETITVTLLCYSPNDEKPQVKLNDNIEPTSTETVTGGFKYHFTITAGTVIYKANILSNSIIPNDRDGNNPDRRQLGLVFTSLAFEE